MMGMMMSLTAGFKPPPMERTANYGQEPVKKSSCLSHKKPGSIKDTLTQFSGTSSLQDPQLAMGQKSVVENQLLQDSKSGTGNASSQNMLVKDYQTNNVQEPEISTNFTAQDPQTGAQTAVQEPQTVAQIAAQEPQKDVEIAAEDVTNSVHVPESDTKSSSEKSVTFSVSDSGDCNSIENTTEKSQLDKTAKTSSGETCVQVTTNNNTNSDNDPQCVKSNSKVKDSQVSQQVGVNDNQNCNVAVPLTKQDLINFEVKMKEFILESEKRVQDNMDRKVRQLENKFDDVLKVLMAVGVSGKISVSELS